MIVEDYSTVDTSEMLEESPIVQDATDTVSQGEKEDEQAKYSGPESEEKHDETVSTEAGKPAEDECEKNNQCEEEKIVKESAVNQAINDQSSGDDDKTRERQSL